MSIKAISYHRDFPSEDLVLTCVALGPTKLIIWLVRTAGAWEGVGRSRVGMVYVASAEAHKPMLP